MKFTKKIVAFVLAFALVASLGLSVSAASNPVKFTSSYVNPNGNWATLLASKIKITNYAFADTTVTHQVVGTRIWCRASSNLTTSPFSSHTSGAVYVDLNTPRAVPVEKYYNVGHHVNINATGNNSGSTMVSGTVYIN